MRCTQWSVAISVGLSLAASSVHGQAALDVQRPKPVVMLLVDSSGSMERMPGYGTTTTQEFPDCRPGSTERNRWAVTVEALTGTFQDYQCRVEQRTEPKYRSQYDYNYHIPHFNFTSALENFDVVSTQYDNGIIDAYSKRVKFGLMTFDGVGTTLNGDTLVPITEFTQPGFAGKVSGPQGMYSYGVVDDAKETGRLSFPNCDTVYGINAGARRPAYPGDPIHAGALIPVGEDGDDIALANENVQQSLLGVRPFGGTPTAALLDDLRYYLTEDDSVKKGSDPYYDCRDRYAVLITDGAPDKLFRDSRFQCQSTEHDKCAGGRCSCPYDTETQIALDLHGNNLLKKLIVIALDVDEEAKAILDGVAASGGSDAAIAASTPSQLTRELDKLLTSISSDAATRSTPQIVNNGLPPHAGGKQYEITAGFRLPSWSELPWDGLLYRRRFECDGMTPIEAPLDESRGDYFHTSLNAQARIARNIVTFVGRSSPELTKDGSLRNTEYALSSPSRSPSLSTYNRVAPSGSPFTASSPDGSVNARQSMTPVALDDHAFDTKLSATLFGDGTSTPENEAIRERIVTYVHASDPVTRPQALADIYHSNPVVLPPLALGSSALNTSDAQLNASLRTLLNTEGDSAIYGSDGRPGVVFVGTNDGVLHAFNLDDWRDKSGTTTPAGHEFWGFVPPALFGKLESASLPTHQEMFDGTPIVRDVMLYRGDGGANSHAGQFATVLLAAVRGAPAYVALDVTRPELPPIPMWQFSAPAMGLTVGTPALAQARIYWDDEATARERAIAILPGGAGVAQAGCSGDARSLVTGRTRSPYPSSTRDKVRCWQQRGRGLYVVDVATGQLIQEFDFQHFPSPLTGAVAVDGEGLDVSSAAYFTDQDGVLWRLSMVDPNPSNWKVEPIWDLFHDETGSNAYRKGRPSIHPPLLSRDGQGNYVILVGTGDVDNLVEANRADGIRHRVVSLLETRRLVTRDGMTTFDTEGPITPNWERRLDPGESVTGPLSLFDKVVYFGTFASPQTDNACDFGNSRVWALDYVQAEGGEPLPRWPDGTDEDGTVRYVRFIENDLQSALVLGVSIATTPVCVDKTESDPFSLFSRVASDAQVGGGGFQIRALLSGKRDPTTGASDLTMFQRNLTTARNARTVGWGGAVE